MTQLVLISAATKRQFAVVKLDKATGMVTLKGEHSEFTEKFDPERFKKLGYELKRIEAKPVDEDDEDDE